MIPSVSIVVPTYCERENLRRVVMRLGEVLEGIEWEVIFVDDDSQDGSKEIFDEMEKNLPCVRVIRRVGKRGLSSACIEGMEKSSASLLAVMDADLQHDERVLPQMVRCLLENANIELTVGTRYAAGGGVGQWSKWRVLASRMATRLGKLFFSIQLTDPMSGFFVVRSELFHEVAQHLSGRGFKILLDMVLSAQRPVQIQEFPYEFRPRKCGESKLGLSVAWDYISMLLRFRFKAVSSQPKASQDAVPS